MPNPADDNEHWRTLTQELEELERTNPEVAAAALSYKRAVRRILEGRSHPLPCHDINCAWHHEDVPPPS